MRTLTRVDQDPERISEVVERERSRLLKFIRRRVPDLNDAEDVLQDVFYRLVEANRLLMPIDHVAGWLFRVARNRIVDLLRKRKPDVLDEPMDLEDLLPSPDPDPEAAFAQSARLEDLEAALDELPEEQRAVFVAHVLEGQTFKEMAEQTGENINTLLARKRYAVRRLRERLQHWNDSNVGRVRSDVGPVFRPGSVVGRVFRPGTQET